MKHWTNNKSIKLDGKTPMQRLFDGVKVGDRLCIDYHQQWKTRFKAEKLGYVNEDGIVLKLPE